MRCLKFLDHNIMLDRETDIGILIKQNLLKQDMDK